MTNLADDFNRADTSSGLGTADTGQAWVPVLPWYFVLGQEPGFSGPTGTITIDSPEEPLGILSNLAYSPEASSYDPIGVTDTARYRGEVCELDGTEIEHWEWDSRLESTDGGGASGALLRYTDEENFLVVILSQNVGAFLGNVHLFCIEVVAGAYQYLGGTTSNGNVTGTYHVELSLLGADLEASVTNPSLLTKSVSVDTSVLTGTKHGICIRNFGDAFPTIDDLNATVTALLQNGWGIDRLRF